MTRLNKIIKTLITVSQIAWSIWLILWVIGWDDFGWVAFFHTFAPYMALSSIPFFIFTFILRMWRNVQWGIIQSTLTLSIFIPMMIQTVPAQPIQDNDWHILTYNKWVNNNEYDQLMTWVGEQEADIVVFQESGELFNDESYDFIREIYPYETMASGGVRLLSRHEFVDEPQIITYSETRSGIRAEIERDGQTVVFYGVHFSLPRWTRFSLPLNIPFIMHDEKPRDAEIQLLLDLVRNETHPVIIAGDFNMSAWSVAYRNLDADLIDSWQGRGWGTSWPNNHVLFAPDFIPPLLRLDYIWHSDDFTTIDAQLDDPNGSDHYPLSAWLRLSDS